MISVKGVHEVLPAYASLMVRFDPTIVNAAQVEKWCLETESEGMHSDTTSSARTVSIPVLYDGEDLQAAASIAGLDSPDEVVRLHSGGDYHVNFLGFTGGFPYLSGLPDELAKVPRLCTPRQKVTKGSVGIAAGQTGVYTLNSPGGWHLLGETQLELFNPANDPLHSWRLAIALSLRLFLHLNRGPSSRARRSPFRNPRLQILS